MNAIFQFACPSQCKSTTIEDDRIFGGRSRTDIPGHSIIYPSSGWFGDKGIVHGYYNSGLDAIRVSALSQEEQVEWALEQGEKVHPGQFRKHFDGQSFSVAWHLTQYSASSFEFWSAEARKEHYPVLLEPQGRVYFAGSYLGYLTGWQAGAIESAWRQIEKLHHNTVTA